MNRLNLLGKGLEALAFPYLMVMLVAAALYRPYAISSTFTVSAELVLVTLGWGLILLINFGRALGGKPILTGGEGSWARRLAIATLGWIALSAAIGYHPSASLGYGLTVLTYALVAQTVLGWLDDNPDRYRWVIGSVAAATAVEVLISFAQAGKLPMATWAVTWPSLQVGGYVLNDFLLVINAAAKRGIPVGSIGNPNYLAEFLGMAFPLLAGWALTFKRLWTRILAGLALALVALALVQTGARAALLGVLIMAPVAALLVFGASGINPRQWWNRRGGKVAVLAAAVVMIGVLVVGGNTLTKKLGRLGGADASVESRLVNWHAAGLLWLDHPVAGAGLGNYKLLNPQKLKQVYPDGLPEALDQTRFFQAHNEPLQVLVEFGAVGGLLIGLTLVFWIRETRRNEALPAQVRFGLLWGVGALGVAGCFGFPLHIPQTAMLLMLTLAVGLSAKREVIAQDVTMAPLWRPAYAVVGVSLMAAVAWLSMERGVWAIATANRYEFVANELRQARDFEHAAEVYALASRHDRYQGHARWRQLQLLVLDKQYDEALALFNESSKEGLAADAAYWKALALKGKGRNDEALAILKDLKEFAGPKSQLYKQVQRQIKRLESPMRKEGVSVSGR